MGERKHYLDWLRENPGPVILDNHKIVPPRREEMKERWLRQFTTAFGTDDADEATTFECRLDAGTEIGSWVSCVSPLDVEDLAGGPLTDGDYRVLVRATDTAGNAGAPLDLLADGAGFLFRPLGALVFGRIGDRAGRKGAFLATVLLMGGATVAIGLLPSYTQAGLIGPILLILMRIIQGFALGGEYGGAAIYVAEHAPANARGKATSWIQTSAAFGLFGALVVILLTRLVVGNEAFDAWGWRIPFLFSGVLLGISIWMRLKLTESPEFAKLKAEGRQSVAPYREAFGHWPNAKLVLIALVGIMFAQGAVWYTAFFYVQTFMERFLKVPPETINMLMLSATAASAVLYVVFGWLSDRVGRKSVMMFGMALMLAAYFPGFHMLSRTLNPAMAEAAAQTPVTVIADPADCSLQFDPVGKASFVPVADDPPALDRRALLRARHRSSWFRSRIDYS